MQSQWVYFSEALLIWYFAYQITTNLETGSYSRVFSLFLLKLQAIKNIASIQYVLEYQPKCYELKLQMGSIPSCDHDGNEPCTTHATNHVNIACYVHTTYVMVLTSCSMPYINLHSQSGK